MWYVPLLSKGEWGSSLYIKKNRNRYSISFEESKVHAASYAAINCEDQLDFVYFCLNPNCYKFKNRKAMINNFLTRVMEEVC